MRALQQVALPPAPAARLPGGSLMAAWFVDRLLPGLIVAALVGLSHLRLWQRIKHLTAEQTKALKGGEDQRP